MTIWVPEVREGSPRYVAIADAIARDVESGALPDGARLPTHRELAEQLGVTVGTVTRGYALAERRGLTVGQVGRGTFVRARSDPEDFGWRDAAHVDTRPNVVDMSLACPWVPPDGEDGRALAATLEEIRTAGRLDELLAYDPRSALPRHRVAASRWIARQGLEVEPERVVVTAGAQHAMTVCLAALLRPGDTLLTAELTYPGIKAVAQMLGLRLRGVSMDEEGVVPEALDRACEEGAVRALYCVPTIQNPTAATMSEERRRRIAEVARRHDLLILEDEIHVSFDDGCTPPIAVFAPERTLHITTLSKWVTFGLRVGFVAAPEPMVERIRSGVRSTVWMPAPLMVEVAARWLEDGTAERLAARKRVELAARQELVHEIIGARREVRTDPRSLHVWLPLPESSRSDECVAQAGQRGVLVAGAGAFAVGKDVPSAVRVSIAWVPHREDVRRGLEILADLLEDCSDPCVNIL